MKSKNVWFYAMWLLFYFVLLSHPALVVLDWNSGPWTSPMRFILAGPVFAVGVAFLVTGMATLGLKNTSGIRDGFVARGPYRFTRNPQYVGDAFIFTSVSIVANSELVLVTHLLTVLVFVLAPLAEEPWLVEQYGEKYADYRREVPRFL